MLAKDIYFLRMLNTLALFSFLIILSKYIMVFAYLKENSLQVFVGPIPFGQVSTQVSIFYEKSHFSKLQLLNNWTLNVHNEPETKLMLPE